MNTDDAKRIAEIDVDMFRSANLTRVALHEDRDELLAIAKRQQAELERLRQALEWIFQCAESYMEGAGMPEFAQFEWIAGTACTAIDNAEKGE